MQALTTGGFDAALIAYAVAATTLVALILGAAVGVSIFREATVERLKEQHRRSNAGVDGY